MPVMSMTMMGFVGGLKSKQVGVLVRVMMLYLKKMKMTKQQGSNDKVIIFNLFDALKVYL